MAYKKRFDAREALVRFAKYMLEGAVVGFAAYFVPKENKPDLEEVILISIIAAATFSIIDLLAPSVSPHVRQGTGFGIGAGLSQWPNSPRPGGL